MKKNYVKPHNKTLSLSFVIFILFALGISSLVYFNAKNSVEKKREEINENLETIYNYSVNMKKSIGENQRKEEVVFHDKIKRNLGFEVYNQNITNKYSALIQDGTLIVYFGAEENLVQYPTQEMIASSNKPANKEDYENYQFYTYTLSSNKAIVTGFSEEGLRFLQGNEALVIPSEIQGKPVKEISDMAFYNKNISGKVVIPSSIQKLGRDSFSMNGERGKSNSIGKPYEGTWIVKKDKWIKSE